MSDEFAYLRALDEDTKTIQNEILSIKNKCPRKYPGTKARMVSMFLDARESERKLEKERMKQALLLYKSSKDEA